jgi:hypothetical protein
MATIASLFKLHRSRSVAYDDHAPGLVPFISNGEHDAGVLGYVEPLPGETVFDFVGVVVSALSGAAVHAPPYIARGGAGSGLVVLEPREKMSPQQLAYLAAYFNRTAKWRFHWYRQLTTDRLLPIEMPAAIPPGVRFPVEKVLPPQLAPAKRPSWRGTFAPVALDTIFHLKSGDHHVLGDLLPGKTPVVSCGDGDNGIAGFHDVPAPYQGSLTIAFNGMNTLTTKYHPYRFAAKDDVAICTPRKPLRLTSLLFVQVMLNRERWRYSYYRKCYMNKLPRFEVPLPFKNGGLDEDLMEMLVTTAPYWDYLKTWTSGTDAFL